MRCVVSKQRLDDPARGTHCTHLACCNYDALASLASASRSVVQRACPVAGCTASLARSRSVLRDEKLRQALLRVPLGAEAVWLRQGELRLECPNDDAGGMPSGMILEVDAVEVPAAQEEASLPQAEQGLSVRKRPGSFSPCARCGVENHYHRKQCVACGAIEWRAACGRKRQADASSPRSPMVPKRTHPTTVSEPAHAEWTRPAPPAADQVLSELFSRPVDTPVLRPAGGMGAAGMDCDWLFLPEIGAVEVLASVQRVGANTSSRSSRAPRATGLDSPSNPWAPAGLPRRKRRRA